ncbi:MAG: (2Fe-2S)-binding protein [Kiloniellales bacterium]
MPDDAPETKPDGKPEAVPEDATEATPDAAPDESSEDDGFVAITVNGDLLAVPAGMSLGAGLLLHGIRVLRHSPHDQAPRGLFCGMGVCFECLVTVDGRPGQQACRLRVRDGMTIELPEFAPITEVGHG